MYMYTHTHTYEHTHTHTHIHNCEQVEPFVNGVAMNKAGWCENAASEVISIGSQGGEVVSSLKHFLNFEIPCTYCPVVFITFSVAPPFADTSGVIPYSLRA